MLPGFAHTSIHPDVHLTSIKRKEGGSSDWCLRTYFTVPQSGKVRKARSLIWPSDHTTGYSYCLFQIRKWQLLSLPWLFYQASPAASTFKTDPQTDHMSLTRPLRPHGPSHHHLWVREFCCLFPSFPLHDQPEWPSETKGRSCPSSAQNTAVVPHLALTLLPCTYGSPWLCSTFSLCPLHLLTASLLEH